MIKPEELRIGNYILGIIEDDDDHVEESICRVISLDKIPMSDYHIWVESCSGIDAPEYYDFFIGIPLTEQWLLDFGFDRTMSDYEESEAYDYYLSSIYFDMANQSTKINGKHILSFIPEHVHQLQNLYFALTGDDLKRKEVGNG